MVPSYSVHILRATANSTRDQGKLLSSGRALMREKKAFLECPVKELPSHEILKTIPGVMFGQGPL